MYFEKMVKWIDHNRFSVVCVAVSITLWITAASCTPTTASPVNPDSQVNAKELQFDFEQWQAEQAITAKRFEFAGEDLRQQQENQQIIIKSITDIATGNIADMQSLIAMLLSGGLIGAVADNMRKGNVISTIKKGTV